MSEFSFPSPRHALLWRTIERIAVGVGTCALLMTVFASWSPPDLRPVTGYNIGWEHIVAFSIIGGCWGFAWPRRSLQLALCLALMAVVIEAGQFLVPGRHPRFIDAATKMAGGGAGVFAAHVSRKLIAALFWRGKALA